MNYSDFVRLADQMKSDWDRRVNHDYRFWMSDGYSSDEAMWAAGERDFKILMQDLKPDISQTFLELGCGVGRLLKPALGCFGKVIGVDVSGNAINKARALLGDHPGLSLIIGNGFDLQPVAEASVDVVVSFAAISSIPTEVAANYLKEIQRVLKASGQARLHMYIGTEAAASRHDTLQLRCYKEANLKRALKAAGFEIQGIRELQLPLQVSVQELGFKAVIVSLSKSGGPVAGAGEVAGLLMPEGEKESIQNTLGQDLEYWMTVNYAYELAEKGDIDKARAALEYAANVSKTAAIDVSDLLNRIVAKIEEKSKAPSPKQVLSLDCFSSLVFKQNLELLGSRFPAARRRLEDFMQSGAWQSEVQVRDSAEGPVIFRHGQCVDHPEKPQSSADSWAKRLCAEEKFKNCSHVVIVGAGAGYHLEALVKHLKAESKRRTLSVVEPCLAVFAAGLELRNASAWLMSCDNLILGSEASLPSLEGDTELWIRPQVQALDAEFCGRLRRRFYGARGLALLHPTIAVVGPLQGGTLPIMAYVSRALEHLEQRVRLYDVSCFNNGYRDLEKFIKEKERRAAVENTYCEMVSQIVLEAVNEKPIDILFCMALAPISPRVLAELRKRGVLTVLWFVEDFLRFTYWRETARFFDFIFTIQKGKCIEALREAGAGEVHYVPVGCDPELHAPLLLSAEEKKRWGSPVSFMGAGYHNRQQMFASLADLPLKIWGSEWPTCRPFDRLVQENGRRLTPAEYIRVFNASDININLHSSTERDGVDPFGDFLNPRTFELASAGAFQLVDQRSLLAEAFEIGKEVITFRNTQELKDKIAYYLSHPEERRAVAARARERALKDHTYTERMRRMLSLIFSSKYEQLKARSENSPWRRMMVRAKPHSELYQRCERAFRRGEEPNLDGLVSDIITGKGKLSETEQKLLFLYHVRRQIIRMRREEAGETNK